MTDTDARTDGSSTRRTEPPAATDARTNAATDAPPAEQAREPRRARRDPGATRDAVRRSARKVAGAVGSVVLLAAALVALVLVAHILLVVFAANPDNGIVTTVADLARPLALAFRDLFEPADLKIRVAVNYGLAAAFYLVVGLVVRAVLRRLAP